MAIENNFEWKISTISNQEKNYTRNFANEHTWNLVSLFNTLNNSSIDSKLNRLESRTV